MNLCKPKEPEEVKNWIKTVEASIGPSAIINWDSMNVWYGNQLPKYLWGQWKSTLKPVGFTWQSFLKLLGRRTDAILMWHKGFYTWNKFIEETIELIEGPLGREISKNNNKKIPGGVQIKDWRARSKGGKK